VAPYRSPDYGGVVLTGRCECRAVAYEVEDEFVAAFNCHCSNCRAMTGAAFLPFGEIERGKLKVTTGGDLLLVKGDPDAYHEARCQACLSLLYWSPDGTRVRVPYGTLIDEPSLRPTAHQFVASKASWYEILDDLPQYKERPGS
jgi:hypothetical protein